MCLVVYSDLLPRMIHDECMKVVESQVGQQSKDVADAFFRSLLPDGRNLLETLHKEGFIKKIQTSQVIVTPTPSASVRLDELNSILSEMAKGEEAVKRLKELDEQAGLSGKKKKRPEAKELSAPVRHDAIGGNFDPTKVESFVSEALDDATLAKQRLDQATKMKNDAAQLLAEATRLEQEAAKLNPVKASVTNGKKTTKKTATTKVKAD